MKQLRNLSMVLAPFALATLSACGGGGGGGGGGEGTPIKGVLLAPDGETPVAGATVYIPGTSTTSGLVAMSQDCEPPPESYIAYTCTGPDGSFTLTVSGVSGTVTLKFKKGSFEKTVTVDVDPAGTNVGQVTLPSDPSQGAPRIAVVTGSWDRMEDVLTKLNVSFDLYDGNNTLDDNTYKNFPDIFLDNDGDGKPDIYNYDIVFINCGNYYESTILTDTNKVNILRDYVQNGGKLYITDLSYDFVEQVFPEYIDFYGSDNTPETEPEQMQAAQVGDSGITTNADVLDNMLRNWLEVVSCVDASGNTTNCIDPVTGKVHIEGFLGGWAVINGPHPGKSSDVKVWVEGEVSWSIGTTGVKPLTVTFNFGSGKVLYTSYHTEPYSTGSGFLPQERILQYLVFF